jgi:LysR family glycine cleavage system transcriptional activator
MLDRRTLPLSALRAFESAGIHLHMGRAGEELGVTYGAISHQVRALEEHLQVKLFVRANNRLKLTIAGERLLAAVQEGFDRIVDGTLHLDQDNLTGPLVIGCTESIGASWAVRQICEFQSEFPQIDIRVVEIQAQQKIIPRENDITICYGKPDVGNRRIERLASPLVHPVCNPRILHDLPPINRPEDIARLTLLHDPQNSWSGWFEALTTIEPANARHLRFFSTNLALSAARMGFGAALCNQYEVQDDLRQGRLVKLLKKNIPESHDYFLLTNPPELQSLRARLFEDWIKSRTPSITKPGEQSRVSS